MAKYRERFALSIEDIDLIEVALRRQQSEDLETRQRVSGSRYAAGSGKSQAIQALLGKIHSQKVFYSHASKDRHPNG